jgi:Fe-S-cluster containining protein
VACTVESGTCTTCTAACHKKPGWLMPGEAERIARHLGMSLAELFRTKLAIDWWEDHPVTDGDVFVLAPAITTSPAGEEYPGDPRGRCVFLTAEGRCGIHAVKPHECRAYWCGEPTGPAQEARHLDVATAWIEHQPRLVELLGRDPEAAEYDPPFGLWSML